MTKQLFKYWFLTVMILIPAYFAQAQVPEETPLGASWSLYQAEGDIILTRDGRRTVLQGGSAKAQGILLGAKDMVQTGKGLAELRLQNAGEPGEPNAPGTVILKLSENTSVVLDSLDGAPVLDLLYGRLGAQSDSALTVRAGTSSAFFEECDAVIEYAARPGVTQPSLVIRCLEGEGELTANAESETGGITFPLRRAETLSLEYRVPFAYVERESLAIPSAAAAEPLMAPEKPVTAGSAVLAKNSRRRIGNTIMGIFLVGAGAAMQGYSYFANPRPETREGLFYGGYAPMAIGTAFLLGAAFDSIPSAAD